MGDPDERKNVKLFIDIQLGNDALQTRGDVVVALKNSFGEPFAPAELRVSDEGIIKDANGNSVGRWDVLASDSEVVLNESAGLDITLGFDYGADAVIVADELTDAAIKAETRAARSTHTGRKAHATRQAEVLRSAAKTLLDGVREPV